MRRFLILVAIAVLAAAPALVARMVGWRAGPVGDAAIFGVAVLAAGFLLSWSGDAAEQRISQGLILAAVALVTVLPEYAVDLYYAYQAGRAGPESPYVHYAAANMTGANRLLIGLAWPLIVLLRWIKDRRRWIDLTPSDSVEIGFLLLASLYAFVIVARARLTIVDSVVLFMIFGAYLWRVRRAPRTDTPEPQGPAAAITARSPAGQWAWMGALIFVACAIILVSAEPFAEAMVETGRTLGLNEFLLIQWLAPLASEAPALTVAVLFVLAGRADNGLLMMISDKINQWTLLVGMLPLAISVGAAARSALPLDGRQSEESFLTAAQSLLGVALLLRRRLGLASVLTLAGLFVAQVGLVFTYRGDEARTITTLTWIAWIYLALAAVVATANARQLSAVLRNAFLSTPAPIAMNKES